MNLVHQIPIRQVEMRNHPLGRRLTPTTKLAARVGKQTQGNRRIKLVQGRERHGKKRRNHIPLLRRMLQQQSQRLPLQPRHLQLNIKKRPIRKLPQHLFERRQPQLFRRRRGNLHSADRRVVANDTLSVASDPYVKLKPVAAMLQTKFERLQGIFRNVPKSPSTAMPQKKRCHEVLSSKFSGSAKAQGFTEN